MNIEDNIEKLYSMMDSCEICPRKCGANRNAGQKGLCNTADKIFIASSNVHMGEEPPITGRNGSGTIFFSNCTLKCVFCQNYPISQLGHGREVSVEELADIMTGLEKRGVHNINFVTPTHYSAQAAKAVLIARKKGLKVPILWNCGGYENVETLALLEGIVDIFLPDLKYSDNETAFKYSGVKDYVEVNRLALKEMKRLAGGLKINDDGIAEKGLLVRHMVLPGNLENTKKALEFIAEELKAETYISLMAQYHPAHKADNYPQLSRNLTREEYDEALECLENLNLLNGWQQEL